MMTIAKNRSIKELASKYNKKYESFLQKTKEYPNEFYCPLSLYVMKDPLINTNCLHSFESEFISSGIDPDLPELEVDVDFYYATLSYNFTEQLLFYGSYWIAKSRLSVLAPDDEMVEKEEILTPNAGVSYDLDERIRLKVHYARVKADEHRRFITEDRIEVEEDNFSVYSAAVSVFF